jgi:putative cell wall-binding protein
VNNVTRLGGADRYETARMVAERTVSIIGQTGAYDGTAFVATGANFPDALGASPLAAAGGWPIYLVRPTGVEDALVTSMKAVGVKSAIILGGPAAVPAAVETDLKARVPGTYLRIAGADRYETAIKVADYGVTSAGLSWDNVAIATGANFPDALAGGPLQARVKSVMLLTPPTALHGGVRSTLVAHRPEIATVRFLGGIGAVSQAVRDEVADALK